MLYNDLYLEYDIRIPPLELVSFDLLLFISLQ